MSTAEPQNEQEMIAAILAGDVNLFHDLIRPYEHRVYAMAFSLLRNDADAEDVAQEAILKSFRNLASFRGESKFGTWLISIVLNEARSLIRHKTSARMDSLDEDPDADGIVSPALLRDWREIPSEVLERQEVKLLIQEAITSLPDKYREIFLLRDVEELSTADVSKLLQLSIPAAKVRLHRARLMLQKHLAPQLKQLNPRKGRWFQWS